MAKNKYDPLTIADFNCAEACENESVFKANQICDGIDLDQMTCMTNTTLTTISNNLSKILGKEINIDINKLLYCYIYDLTTSQYKFNIDPRLSANLNNNPNIINSAYILSYFTLSEKKH